MGDPKFAAALLRQSARAYAAAAVARLQQDRPELLAVLPATFASPRADLEVRVLQLAEAVAVEAPELYADAAAWYHAAFAHRGVHADYLAHGFVAIDAVLAEELPVGVHAIVAPHLEAARAALRTATTDPESRLAATAPHVDLTRRFLLAVLEGRPDDALAELRTTLDAGATIAELHDHVLVEVQREVGRMWLVTEVPIADEHHASVVVGRALDVLQERIPRPRAGAPSVLAFSVGGNLHDLGIRMVAQRLQLAGHAVTNLGGNLPASDLAFALADRRVDVIAMSVTMLLHLGEAAAVVAARNQLAGTRPPILCGGPPFAIVPDLHRRLGAEAAADSAADAVIAVQGLLGR